MGTISILFGFNGAVLMLVSAILSRAEAALSLKITLFTGILILLSGLICGIVGMYKNEAGKRGSSIVGAIICSLVLLLAKV